MNTMSSDGCLAVTVPDGNIQELPEDFTDFEIQDKDGQWVAVDDLFKLIVTGGKVRHRRSMKVFRDERRSALLAELNGVRLYIRWVDGGYQAIMTDQVLRV